MKTFLIILFSASILVGFKSSETSKSDQIVGYWISPDKDLIVKCYGFNNFYYSKVVWFKKYYDGAPNDPEGIPENQWIGSVVMKNFKYSNNEWAGGEIQNLKNGKKYSAFIQLKNQNSLHVTGFIWFRFLSETIEFSRYTNGTLPAFK